MDALIPPLLGSHLAFTMARIALLVPLALAPACSKRETVHRYATRGAVRADEGADDDRRIAIHHEAIAGFRDRDGKVAPMPSMPMAFALRPGHALERLAPGTKVDVEFEVRWETSPPLVLTRLAKLPADTPLTLSSEH